VNANIIIGEEQEGDRDLFFGPLGDSDVFTTFPEGDHLWANVLADLGVFTSRSQARKAGWNRPVELGFSDVTIGKLKHRVTVLNLTGGGRCPSS
jgi:hypothetical protein